MPSHWISRCGLCLRHALTILLSAVETLAKTLGLQNHATFSLFEHRRPTPLSEEEGGPADCGSLGRTNTETSPSLMKYRPWSGPPACWRTVPRSTEIHFMEELIACSACVKVYQGVEVSKE